MTARSQQPKGDTDRRDLNLLLLGHPQLKAESGTVAECLKAAGASLAALEQWSKLVASTIESEREDDGF